MVTKVNSLVLGNGEVHNYHLNGDVFGGSAGQAVEGNKTIVFTASGSLSGGGTVTMGNGGTIDISYNEPTNVSHFTNDANYTSVGDGISVFTNNVGYVVTGSNISVFNNDAGYVTGSANVSIFNNDANYVTSGSNISVFVNDSGYLTTETDPTVGAHIKAITTTNISNWNAAFAWGDHSKEGYLVGSSTDDVPEGSTNQYYTKERVEDDMAAILVAGNNVTIAHNDVSNTITISAAYPDLQFNDTDELEEGVNNLYYTNERVDDRVASILVGGTNINVTYDDANATITIDGTGAAGDFVEVAGDTMTGFLTLSGSPVNNLHAATKAYVDNTVSNEISNVSSYTSWFFTDGTNISEISDGGSLVINPGTNISISYNATSDEYTISSTDTDTNDIDYINSASFNTTSGVLTLSGVGNAGATVDLDGRYLTSYSETDTLQSVTSRGNTTTNDITLSSVVINGDLTVTGNTTTINATELAIEDNLIYLNDGSTATNPDLGWVGNYNDGTYAHTGVFRDATDGRFKFFDSYTPEPGQAIDTGHASFSLADVQANSFIGNATSATKWATGRTLTLSGDVTGTSAAFDGSGNISISTTIAANSVALGTDTTGNYMVNVSAGTGIAISHTQGEGSTATISHADTSSAANLSASGRRYVTGLTFDGFGHVTGYTTGTETVTDTNTTYSAGDGLRLDGTTFNIEGNEIPGGADLNSYRTTGVYSQNANADASSGSNYPVALAGMLEVINDDKGNGLHTVQRYSQYSSQNVYHRYYYNGSWTSWRNLSQDTNTDTDTTDWRVASGTGAEFFTVNKGDQVRFIGAGATSVSFDANVNSVTFTSTDTNTWRPIHDSPVDGATTTSISSNWAFDHNALTSVHGSTDLNTASRIVQRDASGNFSAGTITAALSGNASTASAWETGRTITLTGDVTGTSAAWDGSGNISFATTIAANSVALGTDTTGNYVTEVAVSGNGLGITGTAGEGATFTVTSNATSANTANTIVYRDASGNFSAGVITATATQARYADLAEKYTVEQEHSVGTVMMVSFSEEYETEPCNSDGIPVGIISEKPAILMNESIDGQALALKGRVPVRIVGAVKKGQAVYVYDNGTASTEHNGKPMVGVALETNTDTNEKLVECVVMI